MLYLNSSIYSKLRHCKLISIFLKVTKTSTIEILGELLSYWIVLLVLRVFLEVAKHRFTSSISQVIFTLFAFLVEEEFFRSSCRKSLCHEITHTLQFGKMFHISVMSNENIY